VRVGFLTPLIPIGKLDVGCLALSGFVLVRPFRKGISAEKIFFSSLCPFCHCFCALVFHVSGLIANIFRNLSLSPCLDRIFSVAAESLPKASLPKIPTNFSAQQVTPSGPACDGSALSLKGLAQQGGAHGVLVLQESS
jgi:hypothetical protein